MSMINKLFGRSDDEPSKKEIIESERRQMGYYQQQAAIQSAIDPREDQTYSFVQQQRTDFLKWQQELDGELIDLIMTLKGMGKTEEGKYVVIQEIPLCNDKFIYEVVIPQCKPFFSKNFINSNLKEVRILDLLRSTSNAIKDAMADSWTYEGSEYGIQFKDHDLIDRNIKNCIVPAAYRALDGWTKKLDNTATRRAEVYTEGNEQPKKKGIVGLWG